MATNTGGPVNLNKNASSDTVASALLTGQNANMDKINTAIDGVNKEVQALKSPGQAVKGFDANSAPRAVRNMVAVYTGVNVPTGQLGVLETIPYSTDWVVQYFHCVGDQSLYVRWYTSGSVWMPWRKYTSTLV